MKKILIIFALAMCASCKQSTPVESVQDPTVVIDTCQLDSITIVVDTVGVV